MISDCIHSELKNGLTFLQANVDNCLPANGNLQLLQQKCISGCFLHVIKFFCYISADLPRPHSVLTTSHSSIFLSHSSCLVGSLVVVTHIVNPCHFYIHYLTDNRESETLSKTINDLCCGDKYHFTSSDTVETGLFVCVHV